MQSREELRQNGHERSLKMKCCERGDIIFGGGGGINIVFGRKYRPIKI
jgi:hypothetical protein